MVVEFYYVFVQSNMLVQGDLHLQLPLFYSAIFLGKEFIDEFDGKNRGFGMFWGCFLDTRNTSVVIPPKWSSIADKTELPCVCSRPNCWRDNAEGDLGRERGQLGVRDAVHVGEYSVY